MHLWIDKCTMTSLTVNNSNSSCVVWDRGCYQPFCHILHLILITPSCWMPPSILHLLIRSSSHKTPKTFSFVSNHLYGNGVLLSIVQSLYCEMVKFKVRFFDICKVPTAVEEWPENSWECRYGNNCAEHRQVCRNMCVTCITLCNTNIIQQTKQSTVLLTKICKYAIKVWNILTLQTLCWKLPEITKDTVVINWSQNIQFVLLHIGKGMKQHKIHHCQSITVSVLSKSHKPA